MLTTPTIMAIPAILTILPALTISALLTILPALAIPPILTILPPAPKHKSRRVFLFSDEAGCKERKTGPVADAATPLRHVHAPQTVEPPAPPVSMGGGTGKGKDLGESGSSPCIVFAFRYNTSGLQEEQRVEL